MFVTRRKYETLERLYANSQTALIQARAERDEARIQHETDRDRFDAQRQEFFVALSDVARTTAQTVRQVARQAAEAVAARPVAVEVLQAAGQAVVQEQKDAPPHKTLSPALTALCENYGFNDPKQIVANKRYAMRMLALGKNEQEITQRIVLGAGYNEVAEVSA